MDEGTCARCGLLYTDVDVMSRENRRRVYNKLFMAERFNDIPAELKAEFEIKPKKEKLKNGKKK